MILVPREEEIRVYHQFCGCGGGAKGFNHGRAQVGHVRARFRCIGGVDVDVAACRDFERLTGVRATCLDLFSREQYRLYHGEDPPTGWREATAEDIRKAAGYERPHIVFGSAPCLPPDGLVLTEHGPRRIDAIRTGDRVLTHLGRYREVLQVGTEPHIGPMYGFRVNGSVDVQEFTGEHPIWTRRVTRPASTRRRHLGPATFRPAREVRAGDRVGFPIDKEAPGTAAAFVDLGGGPLLAAHAHEPELWFLLGVYIGDGYRRADRADVAFCVGGSAGELARDVRAALRHLGLSCREDRSSGETNVKLWVSHAELSRLVSRFGDGAHQKDIPVALMGLELRFVEALIRGYRAADGSEQGRRMARRVLQARWKIPSVSLPLLRSVQRLLLRTGTFASIHKCWPGGPQVIQGRPVNTRERWELNVRLDPKKRTVFEFDGDTVWIRIRDASKRAARGPVWNLEVDEDNTFCAPLIATHNCKGFSGLLSQSRSTSVRYQVLNQLAIRGLFLALEAWADDPPEFFLWENVPRIATRGREVLDVMVRMLEAYGYAVAETTHDCGELGGLAQSRERFLLVARHRQKVPPFLYEPEKRPLRAVGEILGRMPLPGDPEGGPMHRMRELQWKTWVRLAFVEAGGDWRSLQKLAVVDGYLRDFGIAPDTDWHRGALGVTPWEEHAGTVTAGGRPGQGRFSVQDPRCPWSPNAHRNKLRIVPWDKTAGSVIGAQHPVGGALSVADPRSPGWEWKDGRRGLGVLKWDEASGTITSQCGPGQARFAVADPRPTYRDEYGQLGVKRWHEPANTIGGKSLPGSGRYAVADPRLSEGPRGPHFSNVYRVVRFDQPTGSITAGTAPSSGGLAIADPRAPGWGGRGKYKVTRFEEPAGAIIAASTTGNGGFAVADPRHQPGPGWKGAGLYGVVPWDSPAGAVAAAADHDNGRFSVADPRGQTPRDYSGSMPPDYSELALPAVDSCLIAIIRALDGTWHRPFTTLELAALQGLVDPGEELVLDGSSDSAWRERIGNAVPSPTAAAIASVMGTTLLLAWSGETFALGATPIWVRPIAVALALHQPEAIH